MDPKPAIQVMQVSKAFKLPHEKYGTIKSLVINMFRRRKGYERQHVLKKVSFDIMEGDFFGIVGRNGGGKSTLLKLLAGIYSPDEGMIQVNGKLTPFIELGVGFNPNLTGRENVFLNGALLGFSDKEMKAMYQDIVDFAELERFMDQKLKNYSSGMQVRLAFSIAIRARSDILLLDEVLAVGDAAFQQKCYNYFEELKREKKTVVFVSHDMGAVRRFCTKAIYVQEGNIVLEGSPADIADFYAESNIATGEEAQDGLRLPVGYKISAKISKQDDKSLELKISYSSKADEPVYVGLSIMRDGVSIAEISTDPSRPLTNTGELSYTLDKTIFNEGIYMISGVSLFRAENRELVAVNATRNAFTVKGADITRGGSVKLADNWKYAKN